MEVEMIKIITGLIFAGFAYYFTEKDNPNSELYRLLHKKD